MSRVLGTDNQCAKLYGFLFGFVKIEANGKITIRQ
jgi:hypothetical protein